MSFVAVVIKDDGMIRIRDLVRNTDEIDRYGCPSDVYHRGDTVREGIYEVRTISEAKAMERGPSTAIMQLDGERCAARLWFTRDQERLNIPARLERWRGCYGGIPISYFQEENV